MVKKRNAKFFYGFLVFIIIFSLTVHTSYAEISVNPILALNTADCQVVVCSDSQGQTIEVHSMDDTKKADCVTKSNGCCRVSTENWDLGEYKARLQSETGGGSIIYVGDDFAGCATPTPFHEVSCENIVPGGCCSYEYLVQIYSSGVWTKYSKWATEESCNNLNSESYRDIIWHGPAAAEYRGYVMSGCKSGSPDLPVCSDIIAETIGIFSEENDFHLCKCEDNVYYRGVFSEFNGMKKAVGCRCNDVAGTLIDSSGGSCLWDPDCELDFYYVQIPTGKLCQDENGANFYSENDVTDVDSDGEWEICHKEGDVSGWLDPDHSQGQCDILKDSGKADAIWLLHSEALCEDSTCNDYDYTSDGYCCGDDVDKEFNIKTTINTVDYKACCNAEDSCVDENGRCQHDEKDKEESCDDAEDNDCDGFIDFEDDDCYLEQSKCDETKDWLGWTGSKCCVSILGKTFNDAGDGNAVCLLGEKIEHNNLVKYDLTKEISAPSRLDCNIITDCQSPATKLLSLNYLVNSHVQSPFELHSEAYPHHVCCDVPQNAACSVECIAETPGHLCDSDYQLTLSLYKETDSHIKFGGTIDFNNICCKMSDNCGRLSCNIKPNTADTCAADEECLFAVYDNTALGGSHAAKCNTPDTYNICCKIEEQP